MGALIFVLLILCSTTCIIEIIPLLFLRSPGKWIKASLLCNVLTNPIVNILLGLCLLITSNNLVLIIIALILEVAVVFFEAYLYYNMVDEPFKKCFVISLVCNLCSFTIGLLIFNMGNELLPGSNPSRPPIPDFMSE